MLDLLELHNYSTLIYYIGVRVAVIMICWLFMTLSCLVDFWSGVSTAKAIGEKVDTHGFRRTLTKAGDYIKVLIFGLMFDLLGFLLPKAWYMLPYATMVFTMAIMIIEGQSVIENSKRKRSHAADIPKTIKQIICATTEKQAKQVFDTILKINQNKSK